MALTILSLSTAAMDHSRIHKEDVDRGYSSNEEFTNHKEKNNYVPTLTTLSSRNEIAVEKFVDTMISSEHYLKRILTIEGKLTHLNSLFHNKTNIILKYLSEVIRSVNSSPVHVMERAVESLKEDFNKIKHMLKQRVQGHPIRRGNFIEHS
ncbi:unnamed protein product [Parnassius apollo]|uniref:(apollo) hypothetical protein n=1 Tax=Parnassius apollo TaxID=110799 RepID=A0A8S3W4H7_PARAO|nr:unnamed protein product [Parnassius apollo]